MISQSDTQGRLRLLRYGLIVVVIVSFFVALLAPYAIAKPWADEISQLQLAQGGEAVTVAITDYIGLALIVTVVVAVVAVVIFLVYSNILKRNTAP